MDTEELLQFLIENGQAWVQAERERLRPTARMLTASEKAAFHPFFEADILDTARIRHVPVIKNPGFYRDLEAMGIPPPLDFTAMEGITFVDTILISQRHHPHEPPSLPLLFHELVHLVQYKILGPALFIDRYVWGWFRAGQSYAEIPMEQDAYQLQALFEAVPQRRFLVGVEVRRRLGLA